MVHGPVGFHSFVTEFVWLSMASKTERRSEAPSPQSMAVDRTASVETPVMNVWFMPVLTQALNVQDERISAPTSEMLRKHDALALRSCDGLIGVSS